MSARTGIWPLGLEERLLSPSPSGRFGPPGKLPTPGFVEAV